MIHYKNVDKTGVIFCTTSLPSLAKWRKRLKKHFLFLPFAFDFTSPQSFCGRCYVSQTSILSNWNSTKYFGVFEFDFENVQTAKTRWTDSELRCRWLTVEYFRFSAEKLYTFNKSKNKSRSVKSQRKCLKNYGLFTFVYFSQLSRNSPQKWVI